MPSWVSSRHVAGCGARGREQGAGAGPVCLLGLAAGMKRPICMWWGSVLPLSFGEPGCARCDTQGWGVIGGCKLSVLGRVVRPAACRVSQWAAPNRYAVVLPAMPLKILGGVP